VAQPPTAAAVRNRAVKAAQLARISHLLRLAAPDASWCEGGSIDLHFPPLPGIARPKEDCLSFET